MTAPHPRVLEAIDALGPMERSVVALVYQGHRTQAQIADFLCTTREAVNLALGAALRAVALAIERPVQPVQSP